MSTSENPGAPFNIFRDAAANVIYLGGIILTELWLRPMFGSHGVPLLGEVILTIMELSLLLSLIAQIFKVINNLTREIVRSKIFPGVPAYRIRQVLFALLLVIVLIPVGIKLYSMMPEIVPIHSSIQAPNCIVPSAQPPADSSNPNGPLPEDSILPATSTSSNIPTLQLTTTSIISTASSNIENSKTTTSAGATRLPTATAIPSTTTTYSPTATASLTPPEVRSPTAIHVLLPTVLGTASPPIISMPTTQLTITSPTPTVPAPTEPMPALPVPTATHTATPTLTEIPTATSIATATNTPVVIDTVTPPVVVTATSTLTETPSYTPTTSPSSTPKATSDPTPTIGTTPEPCVIYAVNDQGLNNSQFITIDPHNNSITALGASYSGYDIEGMDIHPITGVLYATSDKNGVSPGLLYSIDKYSGAITPIGSTGFDEGLHGLSFRSTDATLWSWAERVGLIQINSATGVSTVVYSSTEDIEGLTWNSDGSLLYLASDTILWVYDTGSHNMAKTAIILPRHTEMIEMLPDGRLAVGVHGKHSILIYNIATGTPVLSEQIMLPQVYDDIEAVAWPISCGENPTSLPISITTPLPTATSTNTPSST